MLVRASAFKALVVAAILLSAALLLSRPSAVHEARAGALAGALTVTAASTTSVVRGGTATVPPGGSIVMPVTAQGVPAGSPLAALSIQVTYDPSVLDATACVVDPNHVFGSGYCNLTFEKNGIAPDAVGFNATSAAGVFGNLVLANITFQALGPPGAISILGVVISVFADPGGYPISVTNQNGRLCLTPCVDSDGDGVPDALDNCPNWYNPAQNLPPWPVPPGDPDCDGFTTAVENFVGTNPLMACGANAWPVDFNNDQKATIQDVGKYIPVLNSFASSGPPYDVRFDLNADAKITTQDVGKFIPFLNKACTP